MFRFVCLIVCICSFILKFNYATATQNSKKITKEMLLEGLTIPEKREFKESQKFAPCENFHKYVCDEEESNFKMPADRSYWSFSFTENSEKLMHAKKNFFKILSSGFETKSKKIEQIKNSYLACMDVKAGAIDEKNFVESTKMKISKIKTKAEFKRFISESIKKSNFSFVSYEVGRDLENPKNLDVAIFLRHFKLPSKEYYKNEKLMKDYELIVETFFVDAGFKNAKEKSKAFIGFEKRMAEKYPDQAEIRERWSKSNYETKDKLLKKYPNLLLSSLFDKIPNSIRINNIIPESLEFFNEELNKLSLDELKSIYLYREVASELEDGYEDYFNQQYEFAKKYLGFPDVKPSREDVCASQIMSSFSHEIDEYLISILFPGFSNEKVISLVSKIRTSLLDNFEKNIWLSPHAKEQGIKKIKSAKLFLVKPQTEKEWNFNPILKYSPTKKIENKKQLIQARIDKEFREFKTGSPRERWSMAPLDLNAYYSPSNNQFVMLQGILQPPFFNANRSEIENLGAIGAVVGHELGHGIDDQGAKFNYKGALEQWMTKKDLEEFNKRTHCFIERFNAIKHDGKLTLGENISDNVGLRSAYEASFLNNNGTQNDKQKFFKAYATIWCSIRRPEFEERLLKTDSHALGFARINEQVIHLDGFYEAFGCKAGDKMYLESEKRIKVW